MLLGNTSSPIARCLQCTTTFRRRRRCTPHLRTTVSSRIRSSMALCQSPQSTRDLLGPHTVVVSYSQWLNRILCPTISKQRSLSFRIRLRLRFSIFLFRLSSPPSSLAKSVLSRLILLSKHQFAYFSNIVFHDSLVSHLPLSQRVSFRIGYVPLDRYARLLDPLNWDIST